MKGSRGAAGFSVPNGSVRWASTGGRKREIGSHDDLGRHKTVTLGERATDELPAD